MLSYSAKLFCQWANIAGEWLQNSQKLKKNWKIWEKPTKSGRKQTKMTENLGKCGVLQIIFCQALISVLPSSHFCPAKLPFFPAKLTNFSRVGARPPCPPPSYACVRGWLWWYWDVLTLTLHCWHLAGVNQLCLSFTHSVENQFSVDNGHTL